MRAPDGSLMSPSCFSIAIWARDPCKERDGRGGRGERGAGPEPHRPDGSERRATSRGTAGPARASGAVSGPALRGASVEYDERDALSRMKAAGGPNGRTIAERILVGAAHLAGRSGSGRFSRVDVRDHLGVDPDVWHRSYNPIFQGMREDHPGGAPRVGEPYARVFRRVERASYELSAKGRTLVKQLKCVGDRPGDGG